MEFTAKQTWWLTFALVAVMGLTTIGWAAFDVPPKIIAGISQVCSYVEGLLLFTIHGTVPGLKSVRMPPP